MNQRAPSARESRERLCSRGRTARRRPGSPERAPSPPGLLTVQKPASSSAALSGRCLHRFGRNPKRPPGRCRTAVGGAGVCRAAKPALSPESGDRGAGLCGDRQGPWELPALGGGSRSPGGGPAPGPRPCLSSDPPFRRSLSPQELPGGEPPGQRGPDGGGRAGPVLPRPDRGALRGHVEHAGPEGEQPPRPPAASGISARFSARVSGLPPHPQRSLLPRAHPPPAGGRHWGCLVHVPCIFAHTLPFTCALYPFVHTPYLFTHTLSLHTHCFFYTCTVSLRTRCLFTHTLSFCTTLYLFAHTLSLHTHHTFRGLDSQLIWEKGAETSLEASPLHAQPPAGGPHHRTWLLQSPWATSVCVRWGLANVGTPVHCWAAQAGVCTTVHVCFLSCVPRSQGLHSPSLHTLWGPACELGRSGLRGSLMMDRRQPGWGLSS